MALAGGGAVCVVAFLWWQDRPLREAEAALEAQQPRVALERAARILAKRPNDTRARAIQARAYVELGRWQDGLNVFSRIGAASAEELHAVATALLHLENWGEARPVLERLLQLQPHNPAVLHELAACRAKLGYIDEAVECAGRLSRIPGAESLGRLQLATIEHNRRNDEKTVELIESVLAENSGAEGFSVSPAEIFLMYGRSLLRLGRNDDAQVQLERSLSLERAGPALELLGEAALRLGNASAAQRYWRELLELHPSNPSAAVNLAKVALARGETDETLRLLRPVVEAGSDSSASAYLLQRAHMLRGEADEAAAWRKRAETLRQRERLQSAIEQVLTDAPQSFWARVIRAYRFAESGEWRQAEILLGEFDPDAQQEEFFRDLVTAVRNRGALPSLERLPVELH